MRRRRLRACGSARGVPAPCRAARRRVPAAPSESSSRPASSLAGSARRVRVGGAPKCSNRVCSPASAAISSVSASCQRMRRRPGTRSKRGSAVGLALVAGRFVLGRVPRVDDGACGGVDGNACGVAFERRDHAPAPVLHDGRHPITREIDGCRIACRRCRRGCSGRLRERVLAEEDYAAQAATAKRRHSHDGGSVRLRYTASTNSAAVTKLPSLTYSVS